MLAASLARNSALAAISSGSAKRLRGIFCFICSATSPDHALRPNSVSTTVGEMAFTRHVVRPPLQCQNLGQTNHASLAGAVSQMIGQGDDSSLRGQVDNAATALTNKIVAHGLTGKEHPFQVHRHGAIPSVFGQFFRRIQRDNPGAIDQHIQPPEMGIGLRNRLFYRGFVGDVHHDAQRLLLIQLLGNLHHLCSAIPTARPAHRFADSIWQ
ncbi:Uncharacterised protein [Serratia fonticola]|uniref:Uncharacterized protein n=1 Tax=Serratia fonticola TaxID=47917 RepID=A0A4U9V7C3_SERFO|nr:Uncharacterised protein [Serratia fonticola]